MSASLAGKCCLDGLGVTGNGHDREQGSVHNIISERCCPSDECYPSQMDMAALNHGMNGHLLLPSYPEYSKHAHMYNTVEQRYPNLIAVVKNADDIQKAVQFARKYNLHVTVRSSGHDYVGRSTWEGSFLISLSEMDEMEIDLSTERSPHGTVKVQTGLQWQEIYKELNAVGRVVVGGSAHTVTPGGYTLGGGHSPVSRSLGYAVDNLLEAQVVLADGSIVTATENRTVIVTPEGDIIYHENGDLFWALRGGGGGTFGIAVYFVFCLHPMPSQMVVFSMPVPIEMNVYGINYFEEVLEVFEQQMEKMTPTWGGYWMLNNFPGSFEDPGSKTIINYKGLLTFYFNKFAPWDGSEHKELEAAVNWARSKQVPFTFTNKTDFWDYEKDSYDPPIVRAYMANTLLQPGQAGEDFRAFMREQLFVGVARDLQNHGSSLGEHTPSSGLSVNSDVIVMWTLPGRRRKWGGLLLIKRRYDPDNFFTCLHCVGSDVMDKTDTRPAPPHSVDVVPPNVDGVAPHVGGVAPNVDVVPPNIDGVAPSVGDVAPNVDGVAPNVGGVAPNVGGVAPNVGGVAPVVDLDPPNVDGLAPNVGGVAPNYGGVAPNVDGIAPNVDGVAPNFGGVAPDVGGVAPNVDGVAPVVDVVPPNVDGVAPNVGDVAPNLDGVAPNVGGVPTNVGGVAPNVGGVAPTEYSVANIFKANGHFSSNRYIHFLFSLYEFAFSDSCPE
ncbi:VAO15-like protein [Mya arenaria]|uniref:VAO15-like protein n=1 Tax=Mya arenaria TaxID=6604 RepID=A0ABY7FJ34_MYAAR|nr:VAO15-like protein [Mya arenaria]